MKITKKMKASAAAVMVSLALSAPAYASPADDDIDILVREQQKILDELLSQKSTSQDAELNAKIIAIEKELRSLSAKSHEKGYDAEGAVNTLAAQLSSIQEQINSQHQVYEKLISTLSKLEQSMNVPTAVNDIPSSYSGDAATPKYLVNPAPAQAVSYTQDALNAQGASTMVFTYSPQQIYKIYCRQGYLTDIELKAGETVTFVGGGDTASWSVSANTVAGTPHVYIKPVVGESTTNLIITTDKHSYQLIVNVSDWYNPMVKWTYSAEAAENAFFQAKKDERIVAGKLSTANPSDLDFSYSIEGSSRIKPVMVFSDGEQTFVKYDHQLRVSPVVFVKSPGNRTIEMVNYKLKDMTIVIEKVAEYIELRSTDGEKVIVRHK